jgi:uncharacterized protein YkwD
MVKRMLPSVFVVCAVALGLCLAEQPKNEDEGKYELRRRQRDGGRGGQIWNLIKPWLQDKNFPFPQPPRPMPQPQPWNPPTPPTPVPTPTPSPWPILPPVQPQEGNEAVKVLSLVNEERKKAGKAALAENRGLDATAKDYVDLMIKSGNLSHDLGGGFQRRMQQLNIGVPVGGAGENIAMGQQSPEAAVAGWMGSPGHKANILGAFDTTGVGAVKDQGGRWWWCQQFVSSRRSGVFSAPGPLRNSSGD